MADVVVTEQEAAFLADAERTLARLGDEVAAIGPRYAWQIGTAWGDQFEQIYGRWRELLDRGYEVLAPGSEARAAFTRSMSELNALLGPAQNNEAGAVASYAAALANPWKATRFVVRDAVTGAVLIVKPVIAAGWAGFVDGLKTSIGNALSSPWGWAVLLGGGYLVTRRVRR